MTKKELIKLIREVIRLENKTNKINLAKQVNQAVEKHLNEIFINKGKESLFSTPSPQPTNFAGMDNPVSMVEAMTSHTQQPPKPQRKVDYVSDPTLNAILNDTAGGIPQGDGNPSMILPMDESITEALQEQYGGNIDGKARLEIGAVQSAIAAGVNVANVPEGVMSNLTRNYSHLLNKSKQITDAKAGR